jgi:osmotically-inducible protein OsmY
VASAHCFSVTKAFSSLLAALFVWRWNMLEVADPVLEVVSRKSVDPVCSRVQQALRTSGYRDLYGLSCDYDGGVLVLTGEVGSYFLKQVAQTVAARVPGVAQIDNRLHVS